MFKKADKNELRTWCLGSLMMFVLCTVVAVALLVDIFTNEFKVGTLVFAILAALVAFLFCKYMINSYKAYKTYDERKEIEDQEQKELHIGTDGRVKFAKNKTGRRADAVWKIK